MVSGRCADAKGLRKPAPCIADADAEVRMRIADDALDGALVFVVQEGRKVFHGLSSGANANGFIGFDTVTLGDASGLKVPLQTFGQATSGRFNVADSYDGVIGLAPASFAQPGMVPLLHNAKQQGVIQKNVVTIALVREGIRSPDLPGGTITYGDVDAKNCDMNVKYIPAMEKNPSMVSLDRVSFGGFEAPRPAGDKWIADFGFDSTVLKGPTEVTDGLAKVAGATKADIFNVGVIYNIACNATVRSLFVTLNGQRLEIPGSELVRPSDAADPSSCIFNVFGSEIPEIFSVGAALARNYCLIFDYDNMRLGFSSNLYAAPVSG